MLGIIFLLRVVFLIFDFKMPWLENPVRGHSRLSKMDTIR